MQNEIVSDNLAINSSYERIQRQSRIRKPSLFQLVSATLRAMNQEMNRLLPENPSAMSEIQGEEYASFTVLLAEVILCLDLSSVTIYLYLIFFRYQSINSSYRPLAL